MVACLGCHIQRSEEIKKHYLKPTGKPIDKHRDRNTSDVEQLRWQHDAHIKLCFRFVKFSAATAVARDINSFSLRVLGSTRGLGFKVEG